VVVAPTIVHRSFAIAAMPEGSQKFASESIFNFNFIFKLKFEFRLWEHLGKLGLLVLLVLLVFLRTTRTKKRSGFLVACWLVFFYVWSTEGTGPAGTP
jgi:hypothetical protein